MFHRVVLALLVLGSMALLVLGSMAPLSSCGGDNPADPTSGSEHTLRFTGHTWWIGEPFEGAVLEVTEVVGEAMGPTEHIVRATAVSDSEGNYSLQAAVRCESGQLLGWRWVLWADFDFSGADVDRIAWRGIDEIRCTNEVQIFNFESNVEL